MYARFSFFRFLLSFFCGFIPISIETLSYVTAKNDTETPALLQADKVDFDEKTEIVTATGNVKITKLNQFLSADVVTYNRKTGAMHAHGQVWFKEKTGEIYFSEHVDFTHKMEDGFAQDIQGIMIDNARLAAKTGHKFGDRKMIFNKGVYSPCNICQKSPENAPLWQMKANKIIHNKQEQIIEYHHVRMEWYGMPFFYSPYFRHADPTIKRKSGLLKPEYGTNSDLGKFVSIPVFLAFGQNYDMTLMPIITSQQGAIITGEYRYRFVNAEIKAHGSYTNSRNLNGLDNQPVKSPDFPSHDRWHIFFYGRFDLSDEHVLTLDVNRASDTTYLRRYPVLPQGAILQARQSILTSYIAWEQFKPTHYTAMKGYAFQTDAYRISPFITPYGEHTYESTPGKYGEIWSFDANILSLHRIDPLPGIGAADMNRLSFGGGFHIPYISKMGDMWSLDLTGRWDFYDLDDYRLAGQTAYAGQRKMSRFFPQAALSWRYPWVRYGHTATWTLEPAATLILSDRRKSGGNLSLQSGTLIPFPNEDSQITILDSTTLFLMNRFYGLDRIDGGQRLVYGGYSKTHFVGGQKISLFIGQSRRLDKMTVLPLFSGENVKASHIIGGLKITPFSGLDIINRVMMEPRRLALRISETTATLGTRYFNLSATHTYLSKFMTVTNRKVSQLNWSIGTVPYKNFSFNYTESRNIDPERIPPTGRKEQNFFNRGIGAVFENECLKATLSVSRTAFRDRDIKPATTVLLVLDFKNIGSINPLSFVGNPFNTGLPITNQVR